MKWPAVKLGDVLQRSEESTALQPDTTYREITVRLWGKGVVPRGSVTGAEIAGSRRFVARVGQLIVSRIDARNGAIGIVPPELDGAVVTNDFPLFVPDTERLDLGFLGWLSRTHAFVDLCRRASEGTTNRVRLQEERFLALEIPLPPVDEQRQVVARIDELFGQIEEARELSTAIFRELNMLWLSAVDIAFRGDLLKTKDADALSAVLLKAAAGKIMSGQEKSHNNAHPASPVLFNEGPVTVPTGWVWTTLGSVCTDLVDCVNDTPDFADEDTGHLGLKSTNVRPYRLDLSRKWYVTEDDFNRWNRRETPRTGDILLTREAPVGFACIMPAGISACLTQRLMLLRAHTAVVEPMWLLHFLNGPQFRQQIEEHSRGLTTPHIRVQDAPNFLIPLPPIESQRSILETLDTVHSAIRDCLALRQQSESAIEAILPAALDRVFAGRA